MIRIELPPGLGTQIDYGRVGTIVEGGINRVVWAFCGLLTHSRLPYEEFVRTQDQQSFTGSFCSMWHFYGGSTEFVSPDNLKAGVFKPAVPRPVVGGAILDRLVSSAIKILTTAGRSYRREVMGAVSHGTSGRGASKRP